MSDMDWFNYQKEMTTRKPRPLLLKVLEFYNGFAGYAVELGCGGGVDTIELLNAGWKVYAVDNTAYGFEYIKRNVSTDKLSNVTFKQTSFERMDIPDADLIYSSFSISYCKPDSFDLFWSKIVNALKPGGRFAGNFFGEKSEWIDGEEDMIIKAKSEVFDLIKDFDLEYFEEKCFDKPSVIAREDQIKRWHFYNVIATKK